jgi:hypothetical protein
MIEILTKFWGKLAKELSARFWLRIRAWSWQRQALVLLALTLGIAYLTSPGSFKTRLSFLWAYSRVLVAGDSQISISSRVLQNASAKTSNLKDSLAYYFDSPHDQSPWTAAQVALATFSVSKIKSFIRNAEELDCGCWRVLPKTRSTWGIRLIFLSPAGFCWPSPKWEGPVRSKRSIFCLTSKHKMARGQFIKLRTKKLGHHMLLRLRSSV